MLCYQTKLATSSLFHSSTHPVYRNILSRCFEEPTIFIHQLWLQVTVIFVFMCSLLLLKNSRKQYGEIYEHQSFEFATISHLFCYIFLLKIWDDMKILTTVNDLENGLLFQNYLNAINEWCISNKFLSNIDAWIFTYVVHLKKKICLAFGYKVEDT